MKDAFDTVMDALEFVGKHYVRAPYSVYVNATGGGCDHPCLELPNGAHILVSWANCERIDPGEIELDGYDVTVSAYSANGEWGDDEYMFTVDYRSIEHLAAAMVQAIDAARSIA